MVTKTRKVGAVVALALAYLLIGSLMVRTGHLVQFGIRSSRVDSAPDITSTHRASGNASRLSLTNSSPDANSPLDRRKMSRGVPPVATHSLAMHSKGGGGMVAVITFFILFSFWCFRGRWIAGKTPSHR